MIPEGASSPWCDSCNTGSEGAFLIGCPILVERANKTQELFNHLQTTDDSMPIMLLCTFVKFCFFVHSFLLLLAHSTNVCGMLMALAPGLVLGLQY